MDWHRPRLKALIDAGADYVAIETIPSIKEAECVTKLVSTEFPHTKALVTFSCKVSYAIVIIEIKVNSVLHNMIYTHLKQFRFL